MKEHFDNEEAFTSRLSQIDGSILIHTYPEVVECGAGHSLPGDVL